MDQTKTLLIFENLLDRLEQVGNTKKWKLEGIVSEKEREALIAAFEFIGGSPYESMNAEDVVHEPASPQPISPNPVHKPLPLVLESLEMDEPESPDVLLCLDFGTAMSKAFATEESDEYLLDLKIGKCAGQTYPIFSLISSIFITNSGRILFGSRAVNESLHAELNNRRRFDSIKDILCKDVVSDLDESPLEKDLNPTDVPLTKGDVVTLFLGFFTDMATTELQEQFQISRYVSRRFTRPVLPPERAPWAEDQLRKLLARAQIIADSLHGKWADGIDVHQAKALLAEVRNLEAIPTFLIDEGVVEPVAAVASRFRNFVCNDNLRRLLMVIDVGAGTIDYALFAEVRQKDSPLKLFEIPNSLQVLRQAGDMVDKLLSRFILEDANVSTTDADRQMIEADLANRIRQLKEDLFLKKSVQYVLSNDATGEIKLVDFLDRKNVKEFEKAIHEKFRNVLNSVHPSWIENLGNGMLPIIFTGGGANLPMVRSLETQQVTVHGRTLKCEGSTVIPRWIDEVYPELGNEYPHLAVAIGGASRDIPQFAPGTYEEFGGLQADGWKIETALKGV